MHTKRALVTGVYGQDGSYLAKLLLEKGYMVYGMKRRSASSVPWRLQKLGVLGNDRLKIIDGDVTDMIAIQKIVEEAMPAEVYNTAAMSHVGVSFTQPLVTAQINGLGVLMLLESLKLINKEARFLQCSTSELYGTLPPEEQSRGVFHPRSPYGVAKLFAYWTVVNYREAYGSFACNAISYNHESQLRGVEFVTRKITRGIADIKAGRIDRIKLGNIDAKRDWGHAADFVKGFHMMLQAPEAEDYILATGESHSVREFLEVAFRTAGLGDYEKYVEIDPALYRPAEVPDLKGNPSKIKEKLGWEPVIKFDKLVEEMVLSDLEGV
jgi:GDPmannose 4,6-dehydratase